MHFNTLCKNYEYHQYYVSFILVEHWCEDGKKLEGWKIKHQL